MRDKFILDTNTIIYHLSGSKQIETLIDQTTVYISSISFTELLSSPKLTAKEEKVVRQYLASVHVVHTNEFIVNEAALFRRKYKLKLADAFIAATATYLDLPLVTFDTDFHTIDNIKIIKLAR